MNNLSDYHILHAEKQRDMTDSPQNREFILNFDIVEGLGSFIELQCQAKEEEAGEYEVQAGYLATKFFSIPEEKKEPLSYLKLMQKKSKEENNKGE